MTNLIDTSTRARKHLDRQFLELPTKGFARPPKGWVRAIRDALGLTSRQMGVRMGKTHSTITAVEKGEVAGTVSLNTLRAAAEALDCTLVYALVPNQPLETTVRRQARKVAESRLRRIHHTMSLEAQTLRQADLDAELERLTEETLRTGGSRLWDHA